MLGTDISVSKYFVPGQSSCRRVCYTVLLPVQNEITSCGKGMEDVEKLSRNLKAVCIKWLDKIMSSTSDMFQNNRSMFNALVFLTRSSNKSKIDSRGN
jgi:hypothetical protein